MDFCYIWPILALSVILHWIYRVSEDYYILSFFSRRVRAKEGKSLDSIASVAPGCTIFGNCFDLYGKDNGEVFNYFRNLAKTMKRSYIQYNVGVPAYQIIDAENAEIMLNDQNLISKGLIYDFLHPALKTGILTSTGKKWHMRRKMLTPTFHFNILEQFQEIFKSESIKFVQPFIGQEESEISLSKLIPRFTLNSVCETAMGIKLDDMHGKGDRYRESFEMIEKSFIKRLSNPLYWNNCFYNLFVASKNEPFLKVVHDFSSEIIAKRRILLEDILAEKLKTQTADDDIYINKKTRFAMLDTLLLAEKDGLIDHSGICEEVDTLMFEGYDTTSNGIIFSLMNLALYPEMQDLCHAEIQNNIEDDLSNLDMIQLSKLRYMECFLKETLRLFPPVPIIVRRTTRETELANGLILPTNTQIGVQVFDIHRNPKYWPQPDEFQPERFYKENSKDRPTYAYLPFSAGQRNCIGQKYAFLEMKTLLVVVLKHFKILPIMDPESFGFHAGITLRTKNNIRVKLVKRANIMIIACLWFTALAIVIHWLYKLNNEYFILSFCSRRVRAKPGKTVESIAALPPGRTIFGNCLDLYGKDDAGVFNYSRNLAKTLGKSYIQYGMGVPIYNIIDAENAELILNDQNLITKGLVYEFIHPALKTGLLTSTGKKWHMRRKMLTPTFHFNILGQFQEIFKSESIKFVQPFIGQEETEISLSDLIPRFTLNSVCETAMGIKLDDMAEKGDRYRESFKMIEKCFIRRLSNPLYWNNHLYNLFAASDYESHLKEVHDFSSEIIAKRRILFEDELAERKKTQTADDDIFINKKQRFAMLDTLLLAEKDGFIDHAGICEEVDTLMFEGFDTTSMGLIFGLMNMAQYPEKQELCYKEIQEYIEDDFSNLDITQLSKMKYLECFIKENLRLYPSVPIMGRQTTRETELANGLILPAYTQITLHVFDIHRNPKYWSQPDEFQPERFLNENSNDRHTFAYLPFSAGQRNCIGQKYAILEMKTLLVVVLKHFKVLPLVEPKSFEFHMGITLRTKNNIIVKLVKRK
ncbi:uncharacterized protein LOC26529268 [Drosophila willistoni]|uniref:uncharacterized protein LOC26529268 n=1 Tax=Drosophila willistoni TaxID=7260 RepID=UPI001F085E55|nr:uncharacterized protein LOC26529268 [Drosophila willistoni]